MTNPLAGMGVQIEIGPDGRPRMVSNPTRGSGGKSVASMGNVQIEIGADGRPRMVTDPARAQALAQQQRAQRAANPVEQVAGPAHVAAQQHAQQQPWAQLPAQPMGFVKVPDASGWLPAVSNAQAGMSTFTRFVLYQGGNTGTLYDGGATTSVSIIDKRVGGPSGMMVRISAGALANPGGNDTLIAEQGSVDEACFDVAQNLLVGVDGSTQPATVINQIQDGNGNPLVIVMTQDGTQITVPICNETPPPPPPGGGDCCFDQAMGMLVCDPGDPRDGMTATETNRFVRPDGTTIVVVKLADGSVLDATLCALPPGTCCYDVATGTLRCPNNAGLNGQQVSLVAMHQQADGMILAIVQLQGQAAVVTYPICDDDVVDCCYDAQSRKLICDDAGLNGIDAAIVSSWLDSNNQIWVWAVWAGGGGRMPLCPGQRECPKVLCCVNVETGRLVCPGRPELNGQQAQLADILTEDGFNWGVLPDGTRVPLCGRDCPPPEICPDCPSCPPDLWMSPDGACVPPPKCPPCPDCPPCGDSPCPPYGGGAVRAPMRMGNPMRAPKRSNPCGCHDCKKGNPCPCEATPNPKRGRKRYPIFRRRRRSA